MTHFPLFTNLEGRNILIFGGGEHALQRVKKLMPFSPEITVISSDILPEIKQLDGVKIIGRDFCVSDLDCSPVFAVIAENEEKTAVIYAECRKRSIPVNAVDMPRYCDIIFPSVISTQHLCIGISSGGISPTATLEFKDRFSSLIPDDIDGILEWMPEAKAYIRQNAPEALHSRLLRTAFALAAEKNRPLTRDELSDIINSDI